jgi:hypothetical protein
VKRNSCDTGHFHIVDNAHEFVYETKGKESVLQAVNRESPSSLVVSILELCDDGVVDVLFLLPQKVEAD